MKSCRHCRLSRLGRAKLLLVRRLALFMRCVAHRGAHLILVLAHLWKHVSATGSVAYGCIPIRLQPRRQRRLCDPARAAVDRHGQARAACAKPNRLPIDLGERSSQPADRTSSAVWASTCPRFDYTPVTLPPKARMRSALGPTRWAAMSSLLPANTAPIPKRDDGCWLTNSPMSRNRPRCGGATAKQPVRRCGVRPNRVPDRPRARRSGCRPPTARPG